MRRFACLASAAGVAAPFALAPSASATNARACSVPNGDLCVSSSSGTATNKDRDHNFSTVTQSEELLLHSAVANNAPFAQTIRLTVVLDGPGTVRDSTLLDEEMQLAAHDPNTGQPVENRNLFARVKHKTWPEGTYSLSVTASGSETVTATSTFTVAY